MIGREPEKAYLIAKRIGEVCKTSPNQSAARAELERLALWFDGCDGMRCYQDLPDERGRIRKNGR